MHISGARRAIALLSIVTVMDLPLPAVARQAAPPGTPPPVLALRYHYVGFLGHDDGPGSCKQARRNGTITVEAQLVHDGGEPPDQVAYRGRGTVSMDVDDCGVKPVAGGVHDYCTTAIVSRFDAEVVLELGEMQDGETSEASLEVDPVKPISATVHGDCEASAIDEVRRELMAGTYWTGQYISPIADEAVLRSLAHGGIPRVGSHASPADHSGRYTITLDDRPDPCEAARITLEAARAEAARAAGDAHQSFVALRALSNGLLAVPGVVPLASLLQSQESAIVAGFAARSAAPAGPARDRAEAAYGSVLARVAAQAAAQVPQLAAAAVPAPDGTPPDPRIGQLSTALQQFGMHAQLLATGLQILSDSARRYDACVAKTQPAGRK